MTKFPVYIQLGVNGYIKVSPMGRVIEVTSLDIPQGCTVVPLNRKEVDELIEALPKAKGLLDD